MKKPQGLKAVLLLMTGLAAIPSMASTPAADLIDYDASVLEVCVDYQAPDQQIPWLWQSLSQRAGCGVIVAPGRLLTCASLVRHATYIELSRARSGSKLAARVLQSDQLLNLALLAFEDDPAGNPLIPLPLAGTVRQGDSLTLLSLESSGEFQSTEGRVVEVSASDSVRPLALKVLTSATPGSRGSPALLNGCLAGLSVDDKSSAKVVTYIPSTTLRRFLNAAEQSAYTGLARAGIQFEPLLDPVQRRYLNVPGLAGGVLVAAVSPNSGAATVLQAGDVITRWDGATLDARGYYDDPDYGRLLFSYLIGGLRRPGDRVSVTRIRQGRMEDVSLTLGSHDERQSWVPGKEADEPADYLVEGGLVLRELTGAYLAKGHINWELEADPRLAHYLSLSDNFNGPPEARVVILSFVLPAAINIGYHDLSDEVVTAVNGHPVNNLADVFRVADAEGGLHRISLLGSGVDVALDPQALPAANRGIAATYQIPSLRRQREAAVN